MVKEQPVDHGLVDAKELRDRAWTQKSAPSIQWIRRHTGKGIPGIRVGRLWFYDLKKVKAAMGID